VQVHKLWPQIWFAGGAKEPIILDCLRISGNQGNRAQDNREAGNQENFNMPVMPDNL
jgi:hypothetical protein